MFRIVLFIMVLLSLAIPSQKQDILNVLEEYNKSFGEANYSEIVKFFDYPASFNLPDKTIIACSKLKLRFIYKKIRGDLPDYYSYSNWGKINIQLIDDSIAIVNADFTRHKDNGTIFYSGSAQYHLRFENDKWKIFSLTPYTSIEILN